MESTHTNQKASEEARESWKPSAISGWPELPAVEACTHKGDNFDTCECPCNRCFLVSCVCCSKCDKPTTMTPKMTAEDIFNLCCCPEREDESRFDPDTPSRFGEGI